MELIIQEKACRKVLNDIVEKVEDCEISNKANWIELDRKYNLDIKNESWKFEDGMLIHVGKEKRK